MEKSESKSPYGMVGNPDLEKLRDKVMEDAQGFKAGYCDKCLAKRLTVTINLRKKRKKIGSFCPVCRDINNWVGDD